MDPLNVPTCHSVGDFDKVIGPGEQQSGDLRDHTIRPGPAQGTPEDEARRRQDTESGGGGAQAG